MKPFIKQAILVIVFLAIGMVHAGAQISIAPSFLFIDERTGVGSLFVSNNGSQPHEISISFAFGYPGSDAEGNLVMVYDDSAAFAKHALDPMIRVFPRAFVLAPAEHRTVRIQVLPGNRARDGFFFTRIKVLAKPQMPEVADAPTEGVTARIAFHFEQNTAVFYRRGSVSTGLQIQKVETTQNGRDLLMRAHLLPQGNAPFIGSMIAQLKNNEGEAVAESHAVTTAYFEVIRQFSMPLGPLPAGRYTLQLRFETQRADMQASDLVQATPVEYSRTVDIL